MKHNISVFDVVSIIDMNDTVWISQVKKQIDNMFRVLSVDKGIVVLINSDVIIKTKITNVKLTYKSSVENVISKLRTGYE